LEEDIYFELIELYDTFYGFTCDFESLCLYLYLFDESEKNCFKCILDCLVDSGKMFYLHGSYFF